jgi:hypothetical protein
MKCKCYCDGSPSREVEDDEQDDWEATGQDEMNELHDKCKKILAARDQLLELDDLVTVCIESLMESKLTNAKRIVGQVLYFHVRPAIARIEKELAQP